MVQAFTSIQNMDPRSQKGRIVRPSSLVKQAVGHGSSQVQDWAITFAQKVLEIWLKERIHSAAVTK